MVGDGFCFSLFTCQEKVGKAIPKKPAGDPISQDISITDSLHQPFWLRNQHEAVCRLVTDLNMKRFACRHQSGSGGSTCQGADRRSHHVKKIESCLAWQVGTGGQLRMRQECGRRWLGKDRQNG